MSKIIVISFVFFLICSCEKELVLKGSIAGIVECNQSVEPPKGVKVLLEKGDFIREVSTDADGRYVFENVEEGYYNLTYSYSGYATFQIKNYAYTGFGKKVVIERTILYQIPDFNFNNVYLSLTGGINGYSNIKGFVTSLPGLLVFKGVSLFFDKDSGVNQEQYIYSLPGAGNKYIPGDTIFINRIMPDIPKGEKWFVAIYITDGYAMKKGFSTIELRVN